MSSVFLVPEKVKVEYSLVTEGYEPDRSNFHLISPTVPIIAVGCVAFNFILTLGCRIYRLVVRED